MGNASSNAVRAYPQRTFHHGADLEALNQQFQGAKPSEIMRFTIEHAENPVVFTNFRPLAVAFLHLVTQAKPDIPVIWVDHGYNTPETYRHIDRLVKEFNLNLFTYTPKVSAAHYKAVYGEIPPLDTPAHDFFSRTVKLEPFNRAMEELKPDVWMNGIRHDQNAHRKSLNIFTTGSHGTIRVAPMFHLKEIDVEEYVYQHDLPDNDVYFDPTKGEEHRECGLLLEK
ncbi:phosphoadenosine phosphosulfate reductase domain-containing protein [Microbulbifer thermotolerans]|uniref:Phosphoadenosine phosphosulfate reductase family protein n=1 Tax=Microbulbifer thermotolerans TaxID=252514 RepID=A0A143HI46_MICTH|nr:phosphoadenosine phosphosulfate reductase family protein [Microbulbifer thermotolerans]AMX01177.1 phosphoadenylylsulfate reductase [Microbulbifer thermotolerans]MCX2778508.1 phosphoadenosine phosphosulfate reductase family protein [Microbulbifer thermotolerans]MCX2782938.1 phosphoadenosine phosphosulfate reductase family protein [Microbulbifer thermotolerans]MCX2801696.1 phosphoadenosine phosphosulfate reductase family protein [Microbulbifer thermotolerans]MCX2803983.1 phosphoadenosine phos